MKSPLDRIIFLVKVKDKVWVIDGGNHDTEGTLVLL